jgi:alginate O-acetyltransferase complex protein AlgI
MSITSLAFALFCTSAILIYWRLPTRFRVWWLFTVSAGFVVTWSWALAGILLVVAVVNYSLGRWLGSAQVRQRTLLWIGILFNLFVLAALKYADFYIQPLIRLLERGGIGIGPGGLQFLVSIGLSFITLQMISYLVDIYRHQLTAEKRWLKFGIYVLYFPKFLAGPIERAKVFIPKLDEHISLSNGQIARAFGLIFIGLVRKRLFADSLNALIPTDAFVHPLNYSAVVLFTWLVAYAFAIYNDFAGYSSIVRGISGLFGIELTNNFSVPYLSRSFSEFWNRWHISLSNWLRDYIFFPLSRSLLVKIPARENIINIILPPMITMLVSGLWHGVSWSLLVWGGIHGGYLVLERISKLRGPLIPPNELPKYRQIIGTIIVFLGVALAWLLFRLDLVTAKRYFAGLILPSHWAAPDWLWLHEVWVGNLPLQNIYGWNIPDPRIILVLIPAMLLDWAQNHKRDELMFFKWPKSVRILAYVFGIFGIIMAAFSDAGIPFVYQGY